MKNVRSGDIILMHDFIGKNSPTPAALRIFIPKMLAAGYSFVTVSELIDGVAEADG
jgi:peptidoglycan/xylan/chitin deacetylase (PgdA/CDA1 family)